MSIKATRPVDAAVKLVPGSQLAVFGIESTVSYPNANEYQKLQLNKVVQNDIDGCSLNPGTGDVTLPAGTYIASASVGFSGNKQEETVSVYLYNPAYGSYVRQSANLGYSSDPTNIAKTVNVTTLFTVGDEGAVIEMGGRSSAVTSFASAPYYNHLEIIRLG